MWCTQLAVDICGGIGSEVELCCCKAQSGLVRRVYRSEDKCGVGAGSERLREYPPNMSIVI